jgi:penicillin-binding protein 1A
MILVAFLVIAGISTVFGMLTAVASDLPQLSYRAQKNSVVDSVLYDSTGKEIGVLAPPNRPVNDTWGQISPNMVGAIISVEDHAFWTDPGIDVKSLARALVSDVTGGPKEGASTIAEEFVKNVEQQEDHRTVFEKLREAGMAFQLVHTWKRYQIMTQYLNAIYYGNGAYGIESAARVYFGKELGYDASNPGAGRCGDPTAEDPHRPECAQLLRPYQAALLAGMVANPSEFDPIVHASAARGRRKLVLQDMLKYHYITDAQYRKALTQPLPKASEIQQPEEPAAAPYFTAWVRPLIVRALEQEGVPANNAQYEAYYGGLQVHLSINLQLQAAAQQAVNDEFGSNPDGPTATLVSIDNSNGEVRAMVSGDKTFQQDPYNLAVYGDRQPGSSFKIFTLAQALETGAYGPDSIINSAPQDIPFKLANGNTGHFIVHNDGNTYSGPISLDEATAISDNTVFAQVGMHVGTKNIAKMAHAMGIRTPVSTNPAMIIGGLNTGVSALDMAHAYETVATGGNKVYNNTLGDVDQGAIGIQSILGCKECKQQNIVNKPTYLRVIPSDVASTIHSMLTGVVSDGTGTAAAIPGVDVVGKTGTTSNYVDAWFCGWTTQLTTCVWVGYPNSGKPMTTLWDGGPVTGGTFPATIWHNYMTQALGVLSLEGDDSTSDTSTTVAPLTGDGTTPNSTATAPVTGTTTTTAPATPGGTAETTPGTANGGTVETTPAAGTTTPAQAPVVATTTPVVTPPTATPPATPAAGGSPTTGGAGLGG